MHLFELSLRPWEVKEATPEETAQKRARIQTYEAFCYAAVASNSAIDAYLTAKLIQKEES